MPGETAKILGWGIRTVKAAPGMSPGQGRGLFAVSAISMGEIIDRACTFPIDQAQAKTLDQMLPLGNFYVEHPRSQEAGLLILGLASLCKHAETPNAYLRFEDDRTCGWIAELHALADIPMGQEITCCYRRPPLFEAAK